MKRWPLWFLPVLVVASSIASPPTASTQQRRQPETTQSPEFERRIRDLEFPELRKRDLNEIAAMKDRLAAAKDLFKHVDDLRNEYALAGIDLNRSSANDHRFADAKFELFDAAADLAWANGKVHSAVGSSINAVRAKSQEFAALGNREASIALRVKVQTQLTDAKLALIRAIKVAKAADVDISAFELPNFLEPDTDG